MPRRTSKLSKSRRRVSNRRVSKRRVSKRRVSKRRVSKRRVSNRRVSNRRVSNRRVSNRRVSKRRVSRKRTTKRKQYRRRNKNLIGGMERGADDPLDDPLDDSDDDNSGTSEFEVQEFEVPDQPDVVKNRSKRGETRKAWGDPNDDPPDDSLDNPPDDSLDNPPVKRSKPMQQAIPRPSIKSQRHIFFTPTPPITHLKKLFGSIQSVGIYPSRFSKTELAAWNFPIKGILDGEGKNPGDSVSTPLNIGELKSIKGALKDSSSSPNWYDKYNLLLLFSSWRGKEATTDIETTVNDFKTHIEAEAQALKEQLEAADAASDMEGALVSLNQLIFLDQFKREKGSSPGKTIEGIFQQAVIKATFMSNERTDGSSFNMKKIADTMEVHGYADTWGVDRYFRDKLHVLIPICVGVLGKFHENVKTLLERFFKNFPDWITDSDAKTFGVDLLGWYFFVNRDKSSGVQTFMDSMNDGTKSKKDFEGLWRQQLTSYIEPSFEEDEIHLYFDPWCTNKHEWDDFLVILHALNYAASEAGSEKNVIMYFMKPEARKDKGGVISGAHEWLTTEIETNFDNIQVKPMPY